MPLRTGRISTRCWFIAIPCWLCLLWTAQATTPVAVVPINNATSASTAINITSTPSTKSTAAQSGRARELNSTGPTQSPQISTVITVQSGDTAFLPCHVPLKEEHGVSWVRRSDWFILTADAKVYTHDERVRTTYADSPDYTWTLLIKYIRKQDEGVYDCQITTRRDAWTQSIELRVVEPQAVLVGADDVYVGVGSPFTITCVVTNTIKPPEYVQWSLDSKPLNFGSPLPKSGSGGGGHAVTFDPGPPSVSRLAVHSATPSDSGRYTCQPSSGLSASTQVHVALGNEMAAIQAADAAGRGGTMRWLLLATLFAGSLFLNLYWHG